MNKLILIGMLSVAAGLARADDIGQRPDMPAAYRQECGACHVPYPARGLPVASWQRLMAGLPRHFGTDASLDPATTRQLADWLQAHARGGAPSSDPPEDRLTRSAWFVREHGEVPPALWRSPAVRSASNCTACHGRAAEGRFGEHEIRLPR